MGRTESILYREPSPPRAKWVYTINPNQGSKEAELLDYLKPQDWINIMII